jgi:hypothetical protein
MERRRCIERASLEISDRNGSGAKNRTGTRRREVCIALCTKEIGAAMSRTDQE